MNKSTNLPVSGIHAMQPAWDAWKSHELTRIKAPMFVQVREVSRIVFVFSSLLRVCRYAPIKKGVSLRTVGDVGQFEFVEMRLQKPA